MSEPENLRPAWLPAAEEILQAAINSDLDRAGELMVAAAQEHGAFPVGFAIAWIDTLRNHIGVPIGATVHTHHICADTNGVTHQPPADVAWAARLITARISRDRITYLAILGEVTDSSDWAGKLSELLLVVAQTINRHTQQSVVRRRGAAFGNPAVAHTHGRGDVRPPV